MTDEEHAKRIRAALDELLRLIEGAEKAGLKVEISHSPALLCKPAYSELDKCREWLKITRPL